MGARGLGLGHATSAMQNYTWSLFSNPALLGSETPAIGFYGLQNYGFAEITDMAALGSMPTILGVTALGFHRYGDSIFNETRIRLGYKNEWEKLHFGVAVNYNHISFGGVYGSGGALGLDVGIASMVVEQLWIGAKATNINKPAYEFSGPNEDLTRDLSIGFSYSLESHALFVMEVVKDVRFPVSYRGGVEVNIIQQLKGRVGITTEPITYSFGLGYGKDFWEINFAIQQHQLLGLSPGLDLIFKL
tara:strand:- start:26166 stop:26903 length:738 start_codon:yes stop_codon:yes gene_type:complete